MTGHPNDHHARPQVKVTCPACNGAGYHSNERGAEHDCVRCNGRGYLLAWQGRR